MSGVKTVVNCGLVGVMGCELLILIRRKVAEWFKAIQDKGDAVLGMERTHNLSTCPCQSWLVLLLRIRSGFTLSNLAFPRCKRFDC